MRPWEPGLPVQQTKPAAPTSERPVSPLVSDLGELVYSSWRFRRLLVYSSWRFALTPYLVFSEWERIFANPMAAAVAIDRAVHLLVILEFDFASYRTDAAQQRGETATAEEVNRQN